MEKLELNRLISKLFCIVVILMLGACSNELDDSVRSQYSEISWDTLKPEIEKKANQDSELESLEIVNDWDVADDYSDLMGLSGGYYGGFREGYSNKVVDELDGQKVRIPGFIVPLEFEEGKLVSEFFLVPYFGACFHKPPPPPNQTVYVSSSTPIEYQSIYDPVWIMGVIKTEQQESDIATAAYSMDFHVLESFIE